MSIISEHSCQLEQNLSYVNHNQEKVRNSYVVWVCNCGLSSWGFKEQNKGEQRNASHRAPNSQLRKSIPATSHFLKLHRCIIHHPLTWFHSSPTLPQNSTTCPVLNMTISWLMSRLTRAICVSIDCGRYFGFGVMRGNSCCQKRIMWSRALSLTSLLNPHQRKKKGTLFYEWSKVKQLDSWETQKK